MCSKNCRNCVNMDLELGCLFGNLEWTKDCDFIPVIKPVVQSGSRFCEHIHGKTLKEANDLFFFFLQKDVPCLLLGYEKWGFIIL